ncbi:MAG: sensor histidine kinase [Gemmatimonadaceae bacterium]
MKLAAASGAAVLILLVGAAAYYFVGQSRLAAASVDHTNQVRAQLERTLRTLVDAETGQRGYLLTGDTSYLGPYRSARVDVDYELATLRALTADNPGQQRRLNSLSLATDAKLVELNETVTLAQGGNRDSALKVLVAGHGSGYARAARGIIRAMQNTEDALLAARTSEYGRRGTFATLVIVLGSLVAAALSLLTVSAVRTSVTDLERAKDTIEGQSEELALQLQESQSLGEQLATSNDELQRLNNIAEQARERFAQLLESTDEGLYGMDPHGITTFINTAGARVLGYTPDDLLGHDMHSVIHQRHPDGSPYPVQECPIYRAFQAGEAVRTADEVFWRKDGTAVPVEYSSSPIRQRGQIIGAVIAFNDISERRSAERDRERLIHALARSNQELDQFAYVASHDLKAPLRGIANLSEWVEEDLGENVSQDVRQKMDLIRGRVHRLEALIDGILQYSRAGRVRASVESVNVGALLHEVVELLAPPPEVIVTIGPDMPTVLSERTPLQQVFLNLISNAIKYNRRPGATINVTVRNDGSFNAFSIADNGPGIAPEYHDRIFGIFQTLESRDKVEGTGIGLSVVKKMVELRGGNITVDSDVGRGATFTFQWPKLAEERAGA